MIPLAGVRSVYSTVKGPTWLRAMGAVAACCYLLGWSLLGLLTTLVTGRLPKRLPWALVQVSLKHQGLLPLDGRPFRALLCCLRTWRTPQ